jgi:hypothetical protein
VCPHLVTAPRNETVKELLLAFGSVGIVFGMPLHSYYEVTPTVFYCFNDVVWSTCYNEKIIRNVLQRLVME